MTSMRPAGAPSTEQHFPSQGEAESWLGEVYPDLVTNAKNFPDMERTGLTIVDERTILG